MQNFLFKIGQKSYYLLIKTPKLILTIEWYYRSMYCRSNAMIFLNGQFEGDIIFCHLKGLLSQNNKVLQLYFEHHQIVQFCLSGLTRWRHQMETFSAYSSFVRIIHRLPVNSPHKGQWHGALMFSLICVWIKGWVNNREAGDLRRHRAHYYVIVMRNVYKQCKCAVTLPVVKSFLSFLRSLNIRVPLVTPANHVVTVSSLNDDVIKWKHFPRY